MKLKIRGTAEGAVLDIIQPGQDSGVEDTVLTSIAVVAGNELDVNLPTATVIEQIEYGEVASSEGGTPEPAEPPAPGGDAGGGEQPAPGGDGGDQGGGTTEPPTTSAASEKPLYLVGGEKVPEGFELSGLETPDNRPLWHFNGDTAGQSATGNVDGVSVYADADDNEKPVQPAPAEGQETASA